MVSEGRYMFVLSEGVFGQRPRQIVTITNEYGNNCGSYQLWRNLRLTLFMVFDNIV